MHTHASDQLFFMRMMLSHLRSWFDLLVTVTQMLYVLRRLCLLAHHLYSLSLSLSHSFPTLMVFLSPRIVSVSYSVSCASIFETLEERTNRSLPDSLKLHITYSSSYV